MADWTNGYVADIGYTYGYYSELNPLRQRLAFLLSGFVTPEIKNACELGFGQGISINMHAAASPVKWFGNDFNPSQANFARELAAISGSDAQLTDESFEELVERKGLPKFDYIGLHGIWSWINDENRALIVDFIQKNLNIGGVVYISYNTLPGWAPFAPIRHLMSLHAQTNGDGGRGRLDQINNAIGFAEDFLSKNPSYLKNNPSILDRLKSIKGHNKNYVAHEYFNRDWHPMHFAELARILESAKVQYACSAHFYDHVDIVNFSAEQKTLLDGVKDVVMRETSRDLFVNQYFRRDYWVKGVRRLDRLQQIDALRNQKIVLVKNRSEVSLVINVPIGEITLSETVYNPILDFLADYQPKSIGQIEQAVGSQGINLAQIVQAILLLSGAGSIYSAQDDDVAKEAKNATEIINVALMKKARGGDDIQYLASPVTGGGVPVVRFHQLFLLAILEGRRQPLEWAQFVWTILQNQGQTILKDGKGLATAEENLQELLVQATDFEKKHLPVLKALMIAA